MDSMTASRYPPDCTSGAIVNGSIVNRMTSGFNFLASRKELIKLLQETLLEDNFTNFIHKCQAMVVANCENDMKSTVDQALRDVLAELIQKKSGKPLLEKLISLSIVAAEADICPGNLPVILLSDMFDCVTLDECEELFTFVEERVNIWKKDLFFKNCKNQLLRSCNDLLRRLSRSQNTVFCGRILVFLARFFPLSERSGLNIISEFNLDNITMFSAKDDGIVDMNADKDESMEEGEMDDTVCTIVVDYNLYLKFWSLQKFFHQPNLCYNKMNWRHFALYSADILSAFGSFKLDDIKSAKWKLAEASPANSGKPVYFAKYLTSQKLLELELSDSNFRRYILVQFLVLFQYLQSSVRFKQDTFVLSDDQQAWIKETTDRVHKLLEETPPNGTEFSKHVAHILKREEYWNTWKNDGCPDFKNAETIEKTQVKPQRQKRKLGDEVRAAVASKKVLVGNAEMNRLWNLCPDNWEACRSQNRDFVPSLETFFEVAIEQADPANQIENCYKHVYDSNYGWRALRLLSHKLPHFFTHSNQPIRKLPLYLESMVLKVAKEFPLSHQHSHQQIQDETKPDLASVAGDTADSEDEFLKNSEEAIRDEEKKKNPNVASIEMLSSLAETLQKNWKILAFKLGFKEDEIEYMESEHQDATTQGRQMLVVWLEQEGGFISVLKKALEELKLWDSVKGIVMASRS